MDGKVESVTGKNEIKSEVRVCWCPGGEGPGKGVWPPMIKDLLMLRATAACAAISWVVLCVQTQGAEAVSPDGSTTAFAERHSPMALAQAARDLFPLTFIPVWGPQDFKRPGRWERLGKVRAALDSKDVAGAVEEFKRYSFEKLKLCDGENGFGVSTSRMDPWSIGEPRWKWLHKPPVSVEQRGEIVRKADDLLNGVAIGGKNVDGRINGATSVTIAKPGSIDWRAASRAASRHGNEDWPWRVEAFHPLLRRLPPHRGSQVPRCLGGIR